MTIIRVPFSSSFTISNVFFFLLLLLLLLLLMMYLYVGLFVFPYAKCSKWYYVTVKSGIILFYYHPYANDYEGNKTGNYALFLSYKISQIAHCQDRDIKNI